MPPKAKFERGEIIDAALRVVREHGLEALTARSLGAALGSSARPVFTVFDSMEEVIREVEASAKKLYNGYISKALADNDTSVPRFKMVGQQYILFAIREPKLFQLLFMKEMDSVPEFKYVLPVVEENYNLILNSVKSEYGLDDNSALKLYKHLWVYSHGIASLCTMKMCTFSAEEIGEMMTEIFKSLLKEIRRNSGD